ncbi:MAG: hypothetical protein ABR534_08535 [Desulfotignum sp.]
MYLTAMTHREELFNLTMRWMNDDFHPDDGEKISRIFLYESAISAMVLDRIIQFLNRLYQGPLQMERIHRKADLRRQLIAHRPGQNPRMDELAEEFNENPTYFFPHLPIDAVVITDKTSRLIAITRIKRLSRIAEKVSFRLVDALHKEIQAKAEKLADHRAGAAGLPLKAFVSSPSDMQKDFIEAEASVVRRFRDKQVKIDPKALTINDIIGFKIIDQPEVIETLPELFSREPGVTVVEIERHQGHYNAVNLLLDIALPARDILTARLSGMNWETARLRGLDPDEIQKNLSAYVSQGAGSVRIELILTTPEELLEAEFGRSIHELRVLRLRQRQAYGGLLGQNAGYLVEYLLSLAASPITRIPQIPIKLYGRYLPEEIATLKCDLHDNTIDGGLLGTFCLQKGCPGRFCPANQETGRDNNIRMKE